MADQDNENSTGYKGPYVASGAAVGWATYKWTEGVNYVVKVKNTGSSAVQFFDKGLKNTKALMRIDRPHRGMPFDHININPKPAGLKADPHIRLPSGSADASANFADSLKTANSVIETVAIGLTVLEIGQAVYHDYYEGTHQKKTETAARIVASSTAASLGAKAGAAIGTAIFPGIGTVIGAFAGGVGSSIGASYYATKLVHDNYDTIAEKTEQFAQTTADAAKSLGNENAKMITAKAGKIDQSTIDVMKTVAISRDKMLATAETETMSIVGNYFRLKSCYF